MSKSYELKAEARDRAGKGISRALRRENKVPAVVYGDSKEAFKIALPGNELHTEWHKGRMFTALCDLDVEGKKHQVLARDVQLHPVSDKVIHVDFLRVTDKTSLTVSIPVHFLNEDKCPGLLDKGILNFVRFEVDLIVKATAIPESIEIDLMPFNVGDSIKISDANLPEGAVPEISDRDFTIATIDAPRAMIDPADEPGADDDGIEREGEEGGEGAAEGAEGEASEGSEEAPKEE